ncbi:hypothetical protein K402DRAFT_406544 [Aulographum hederae CBS 113979]|uniref:Cenp-O kinetochore centromere component n=1 Tax=Aulographum hederae CBS 113979 TaxID=1176131 RepID=A0A6G1GSU6_9PEZI|nr:hypothetical protein K402DRAFT_406544 [Aulographum hederae CBS 113979]
MEQPALDPQLDEEIANIRKEIAALKTRRSILTSTLLSSSAIQSRITKHITPPTSRKTCRKNSKSHPLLPLLRSQTTHNATNIYRTLTSTTAFKVLDPDPHAVDSGRVLGIRIDIFDRDRFVQPYYVLLNCPWPASQDLRVHRHTVPAFVGLQKLATRWLPVPKEQGQGQGRAEEEAGDADTSTTAPLALQTNVRAQSLPRFVKTLRAELVHHHKRVTAIERLQEELKSTKSSLNQSRQTSESGFSVAAINMLDTTGRELELQFTDGALGRVKVGKKGEIEGAVVRPPNAGDDTSKQGLGKRKADIERRIIGLDGGGRIEGLLERMMA